MRPHALIHRVAAIAGMAIAMLAAMPAARAQAPMPGVVEVTAVADTLRADAYGRAAEVAPDSVTVSVPDTASTGKRSVTLWIKQLWDNGFHINDPGVDYPRFPRFCRNVYNWGDRVFNSYDTAYVVATGRNWKLQAKSYNWLQDYLINYSLNQRIDVRSSVHADIGAYLSFMAVSIGYTWNANKLFGLGSGTRSNFNVNFTCALFTIDFTHQVTYGGAHISSLTSKDFVFNDNSGKFDDISNKSTYLTGYYFFNHRKYSHAAAYCFSKYQLKSAGSWILGFSWIKQRINMDFRDSLNDISLRNPSVSELPLEFNFDYSDYTAQAGYGYSWALKPRVWLINIEGLLGFGYKHSKVATQQSGASESGDSVAIDGQMLFSVVYNHRKLFLSLQNKVYASIYPQKTFTFFNVNAALQFIVGMRF